MKARLFPVGSLAKSPNNPHNYGMGEEVGVREDADGEGERRAFVTAGPGQRLAAAVVDQLIVIVVFTIAGIAGAAGALAGAVWVAVSLAVQLPLGRGHTPGMAVLGIEAVDARTGAVPGLPRALVRWFVPVAALGTAVLVVQLLGGGLGTPLDERPAWFPLAATLANGAVVVALYRGLWRDPRRQGLHDKAAGTLLLVPADRDDP